MKRRAIKKVCVQAEFGFFLMICLFLLMDFGGMGGMCLAAVCLHEAGHLAVLFFLGEQIREIRFCFGGIRIERGENLSLRGEAAVHLSGPCANLCAALCLFESGIFPFPPFTARWDCLSFALYRPWTEGRHYFVLCSGAFLCNRRKKSAKR